MALIIYKGKVYSGGLKDVRVNGASVVDGDVAYVEVPSLDGYATEEWVDSKGFVTESYHDNTKQNVISDLADIRSGASKGSTSIQPGDDISELTNDAGYQTAEDVSVPIENLQEQIDAITSQSDVVDVVGTYAELVAYTKPIYKDDIVKVLVDESHNDAITYYRLTTSVEPPDQPDPPYSWTYIGSQGPFYTKSETDVLLSGKQATISDLSEIRSGAALGTTSVQPGDISDMASKTWVGQQGFLTEHQSLAGYATETYVDNAIETAIGTIELALQEV